MYEPNHFFIPPDENVTIWRYMSFTKFVSMLDKKALFFPQASNLEDPYEGVIPESYFRASESTLKPHFDTDTVNRIMGKGIQPDRDWFMICSWHMNNYQSAAMWRLFLDSENGIAIKSTFENLSRNFNKVDRPIHIGKVNYIDYDKDNYQHRNMQKLLLHKRKSFEHERELRAIAMCPDFAIRADNPHFTEGEEWTDKGVYFSINLDVLVDEVYVAPLAEDWFSNLVESVTIKYALEKPVRKSNLYDGPVY